MDSYNDSLIGSIMRDILAKGVSLRGEGFAMKPKFNRMYAFREIKAKPWVFIPIFITALVSMIFIFNMLIYMESKRVSDIHYYNVGFEIILHEMKSEDIPAVENLSYVKSLKAIKFKGTSVEKTNSQLYTLHVHLYPDDASDPYKIYKRCDQIIENLNFWETKPYYERWKNHRDVYGIHTIDEFYNIDLLSSLRNTYIFTGWTGIGMVLASVMMGAEMIIIFGMKIKSRLREYAALRSCGLRITSFVSINAYQVVWMVSAAFPPAFFISMLVMKLICSASNNLYPEIKDNTPLIYSFPAMVLFAAFLILLFGSWVGIRFLCMRYEKTNVAALINGEQPNIPYIEKSSDKIETGTGLGLYSKIVSRRLLKGRLRNVILTLLLVMFPMILSYAAFMYHITAHESTDVPAYTIYSGKNGDSVSMAVIDKIRRIDGIERIDIDDTAGVFYANQAAISDAIDAHLPNGDEKKLYMISSYGLEFDFIKESDPAFEDFSFDLLEEPYSVAVHQYEGNDGDIKVGDTINITVDGTPLKLTVAYVIESDNVNFESNYRILSQRSSDMGGYTYKNNSRLGLTVLCSPYTMSRVFGVRELCSYAEIYAEVVGCESEVISQIEKVLGSDYSFKNEFEMSLYHESWFGINTYAKTMKEDALKTYTEIFLMIHIVLLYACTAVVISFVSAFETRNRRRELAILRAFGAERKEIINRVSMDEMIYGLSSAVFIILFPFALVLAAVLLTILQRTLSSTLTILLSMLSSIVVLLPVFIAFTVFLVSTRVISARYTSVSVTKQTVAKDLSCE